jgi:hypothetical protein
MRKHLPISVLLLALAIQVSCRDVPHDKTIAEIAIADIMLNNLDLVKLYHERPSELKMVFRAIARDWVAAEKSPDLQHGGTDAYHLKRIADTKARIVAAIGSDG